ncbi:DUF4097 family beta strand repeat-containing protein [Actinoplanes couchii]|uniref:DUF4097 domain-containing protein n=1 Tax=Actinoplanes couchii TaxID=403638 RepID=A0ABQ3XQB8_9ACTN|nr:DUF4097 family beta strand repeat-containing protein [Actinoplanes couchii]MDR6323029.1 hypothetical protein [Actinoplanes couchii]GID60702.1 hypothetical protein Aco03nite_091060 [Actinoplanes couchii]
MTRRVALILAAVSVGAVAGCDGVVGARMTFNDVEKTKITEIVVSGRTGNVMVDAAPGATETTIRRIVRGGTSPDVTYQVSAGVLTLATDCGNACDLTYEITTPPGVGVRGELNSGFVQLTAVGSVDLTVKSGDVLVQEATGPVKLRANSGDMEVIGGGAVDVETRSGEINVTDAAGPVTTKLTSGDIRLTLARPTSVTASATSGDIDLVVPEGDYRVATHTGSGEARVEDVKNDPKATNVLDLRTRQGDVRISAA